MSRTNFVQFSDDRVVYTSRPFDGYLAFIPESVVPNNPNQQALQTADKHESYRYFSGKDFCWFEFKDTGLPSNLSMQITASDNFLWLLINMRTGISLTLEQMYRIPTDMLLCYQTLINDYLISLDPNSSWFLLLGIDGQMIQELTTEYTQLKPLLTTAAKKDDKKENASHRIIGTLNLHAKLKRILDRLQQMEFRPFSTYFQLANWNMRFFRQVFQEMEPPTVDRTDHEIELYYKALTYIRQHFYDDQTNIEAIATALNVSKRTLERAFEDKPYSITEQIIEFRLQEARACIQNSDKPISTIAASLNFACPKNFKRLFIKRFLISPLQYRESMKLKRFF